MAPRKFGSIQSILATKDGREAGILCSSVCTPLDEATLQAAIDRVTAALATADDDAIAELVAERRAMREELRAMREETAGVTHLDERASRVPKE